MELVLELELALEQPGVHELDGDVLAGVWDYAEEHGPGAALAESVRRRERVGHSAEDRVGVPVGGLELDSGAVHFWVIFRKLTRRKRRRENAVVVEAATRGWGKRLLTRG
ncbi:hypothetical protein ACFX1Z_044488 [Malus domestica]